MRSYVPLTRLSLSKACQQSTFRSAASLMPMAITTAYRRSTFPSLQDASDLAEETQNAHRNRLIRSRKWQLGALKQAHQDMHLDGWMGGSVDR